ncbi:Gcd10p family-domain-containing protein [Entophlyctis helioformis]|nr:Gcd10p family-domain-containing protein [Entophlyctis helioformis]
MSDVIKANEWVFLQLPSGNSKVFVLKANDRIELGKFGTFSSNDLIGKLFSVPYEITNDGLRRYENADYLQELAQADADEELNTNQTIVDDPSSQKLTQQDIEALKSKSMQGLVDHGSLIQMIAQNHAGFEKKTDFSKAKYIKRKQKKFSKVFTPVRPTVRVICEHYLTKKPEKIREMRMDTLSQMLTFANVRAGSRFLVVDEMAGLLVGAMIERMHEFGKIIVFHDKDQANLELVKTMNFPQSHNEIVSTLPWFQMDKEPPAPTDSSHPDAMDRALKRYEKLQQLRATVKEGNFDGLLVASRFDTKEILEKLCPLLAPSKPVVVYSPHKEDLLDAFYHVRVSRRFINAQVTESWMREYQVPVFASGTHPSMMTSGTGGYLLSMITIIEEGKLERPLDSSNASKRAKKAGDASADGAEAKGAATAADEEAAMDE